MLGWTLERVGRVVSRAAFGSCWSKVTLPGWFGEGFASVQYWFAGLVPEQERMGLKLSSIWAETVG
jgi:hypothetical protein